MFGKAESNPTDQIEQAEDLGNSISSEGEIENAQTTGLNLVSPENTPKLAINACQLNHLTLSSMLCNSLGSNGSFASGNYNFTNSVISSFPITYQSDTSSWRKKEYSFFDKQIGSVKVHCESLLGYTDNKREFELRVSLPSKDDNDTSISRLESYSGMFMNCASLVSAPMTYSLSDREREKHKDNTYPLTISFRKGSWDESLSKCSEDMMTTLGNALEQLKALERDINATIDLLAETMVGGGEIHCGHQQEARARAGQVGGFGFGGAFHVGLSEAEEDVEVLIDGCRHTGAGHAYQSHRQQARKDVAFHDVICIVSEFSGCGSSISRCRC